MTTPPTPQPQPAPLHPLLLLADWLEAGRTLDNMYASNQPLSGQIMQERARLLDRLGELDPAALRAQAAALAAAEAREEALRAALERAEGDLARERSTHSETIDQRDTAQEAADRLAYALFSIDEIGEHSSSNCPWENAAERLEEMAAISARAALGGTQ